MKLTQIDFLTNLACVARNLSSYWLPAQEERELLRSDPDEWVRQHKDLPFAAEIAERVSPILKACPDRESVPPTDPISNVAMDQLAKTATEIAAHIAGAMTLSAAVREASKPPSADNRKTTERSLG